MKQEIVCKQCEIELRKQFPNESPYPGEHVKFVVGTANKQYRCDHCDVIIPGGEECCAFSIYANYGGVPYYNWEKDFIN